MLSGWVANTSTASDATKYPNYVEIDGEYDEKDLGAFTTVYYCGNEEDGHVKKNKWIKTWQPKNTYDEDEDVDKFWYWIEKDGKVYIPSASDATATKYKLADGKMEEKGKLQYEITKKKVNSKDYFFNEDGEMMSQFMEIVDANDIYNAKAFESAGMYYLGGDDDGSMKTGSQTVKDDNGDSYKFYFGTRTATKTLEVKGVGITGNKSSKLYYKGLLLTADDYKYQSATLPNGKTYIVNKNGNIQHSSIKYTEDGDTLIDATKAKFADTKDVADADKYSLLNPDVIDDAHPIDIYKVILQ